MKRIIIFSISMLLLPMLSFAAATTDRTKYCYMYGTFDGNYSSIGNAQAQCFTVQSECQNSKKNIDFTAGGVISVDGNDCTLNQTGFVGQTAVETGTSYTAYGEVLNSNVNNTGVSNVVSPYPTQYPTNVSGGSVQTYGSGNYQLLSQLGGLTSVDTRSNFSEFISVIYKLAIGLGAVMAVFMILFSGIKYMLSDVAGEKIDLKERLLGAVGGLVFLIAAVAMLNIINPKIASLTIGSLDEIGSLQSYSANATTLSNTSNTNTSNASDNTNTNQNNTDSSNEDPSLLEAEAYNPMLNPKNHDTTDGLIENDPLGTIYNDFPGGGWVHPSTEPGIFKPFATKSECENARNSKNIVCVPNTDIATPTTSPPSTSKQILTMSPKDDNYDRRLTPAQAAKIGWPVNPYRRPADFASKGNKQVRISRTAVEMDKYFNDEYKSKFGINIRLVSAYRDPTHNAQVGSTANNHQLGYSLDYGTKELNQEQLNFLQDLIIKSGVVRVGWGRTNDAGTHVQWDDGHNAKWVYWCYQKGTGPHKGRGTMPKQWRKGGSCGW